MKDFRNLDESFFRVNRNGKWQEICFSDLTKAEKYDVMEGKSRDWLQTMCIALADTIRNIGDTLDIRKDI